MIKKIISYLYKNFVQPTEKPTEVENKEDYYNNKYPKTDIFYRGRPVPNTKQVISIDVRNFFNLEDKYLKDISETILSGLGKENPSDDEIALACLEWVIKYIKYIDDKNRGYNEFWQYPYETLNFTTGDCEDGAIFLANLLQISGIPYWKIRLTAGDVRVGTKKTGHAYVTYYCMEEDKWVVLDWCYWPNTLAINLRKDYKEESNYLGVWFSWNYKYAYSEGLNKSSEKILK